MMNLPIRPMTHFIDSAADMDYKTVADNLLQNNFYLFGDLYYKPTSENIFELTFEHDEISNREFLFKMDYLSALLSAYRETANLLYQQKFIEIVNQFFEYKDNHGFSPTASDDYMVYGQVLMFIKSFSLIQYEELLRAKIIGLLYTHAQFCFDDRNHWNNDNHGYFTDTALLHLSVLFEALPEASDWQRNAIHRVKRLFDNTMYEDGFNCEGSVYYFRDNIIKCHRVIEFCNVYKIDGLETIVPKLERCERVFRAFAYKDGHYPLIGDGVDSPPYVRGGGAYMTELFPHGGICVVKAGEMYLTLKYKSVMQAHTHVDELSITARFRSVDLALDPGQYNYDRFHPVNRFLRTSGGHSGIFPLFADGLALGEYLSLRSSFSLNRFACDGSAYYVSAGYEMNGGAIRVHRDIVVKEDCIEVRDSWACSAPQTMRQRFVLPKEVLALSRFTASKRMFETTVDGISVNYTISSEHTPIVTTMNFGVQSKLFLKYEPTVLLDTIAENSTNGEIVAVIRIEGT